MTSEELEIFRQIEAVKGKLKEIIRADGSMCLSKNSRGQGRRVGRFEMCQWIDVEISNNDEIDTASILFFEDARIDVKTGNLHPGRYGYVVFQKWRKSFIQSKAPNILLQLGKYKGVFVPLDKHFREETGICVIGSQDNDAVADEVFLRFLRFLKL